jgi:hypothetical protein
MNIQNGLFIIQLEDGGYSIFETNHIESFRVKDVVSGHLDKTGIFEILNATRQIYQFVLIQYVGLTLSEALAITHPKA